MQLGGSDPAALAQCARIAPISAIDEINLNVGCPSDRVQDGRFGACLMAEPALVGECVAAMKAAVAVPVTVKCRIGIDDQDPEAGARCARRRGGRRRRRRADRPCPQGLAEGPVAAREPRRAAARLCPRLSAEGSAIPGLPIVLNGGIATLEQARAHSRRVDGVMMGRAAYQEPWRLLEVDPAVGDAAPPVASAREAALAMIPYIERELARGVRLNSIVRHMLGLFPGVPGARAFRRHLATRR